jgi:hypothetical protein
MLLKCSFGQSKIHTFHQPRGHASFTKWYPFVVSCNLVVHFAPLSLKCHFFMCKFTFIPQVLLGPWAKQDLTLMLDFLMRIKSDFNHSECNLFFSA